MGRRPRFGAARQMSLGGSERGVMRVDLAGAGPRRIWRFVLGAALAAATAAHATPLAPEPRKPIDPNRYLGRWYEIARVPNTLQERCEGATSDWSKAGGDQYNVVQTCHIGAPNGPAKVWRGAGRLIAPSKIRIGFFGGFVHQDYWVIDRDEDYNWSIMGTPNPRYVWIFSRRAVLTPAQKAALVARAKSLGYDTANLVYDEQAGS
jgi:apolipoprotein D and lipocalin family protein